MLSNRKKNRSIFAQSPFKAENHEVCQYEWYDDLKLIDLSLQLEISL